MSRSRHLRERELRALERLGDVLVPGIADMPSFSALGCIEHADRILDFLPERDLSDLRALLRLLSWWPRVVLAGFWRFLEWAQPLPVPPGATLRQIRFGLRGLVLSLYYSGYTGAHYQGQSPLEILDYGLSVYVADLEA